MDFTIRIYKDTCNNPTLSSLNSITISNITLITKPSKFEDICLHKGNQKKFGYSISLSKSFNKISGSHSTPTLTFKDEYIDIIIKNFPRYPSFGQDYMAAINCLNGYGYVGKLNKGFPHQLLYRNIQIITN
jgi:hypothetical protein